MNMFSLQEERRFPAFCWNNQQQRWVEEQYQIKPALRRIPVVYETVDASVLPRPAFLPGQIATFIDSKGKRRRGTIESLILYAGILVDPHDYMDSFRCAYLRPTSITYWVRLSDGRLFQLSASRLTAS